MAIIYAPIIDNQLKAFYCVNSKLKINIPFQHNPLIDLSTPGIKMGIQLYDSIGNKIGDDTKYLGTLPTNGIAEFEINYSEQPYKNMRQGWYYKFQLVYAREIGSETEVGPYTQMGVLKFTTLPDISISYAHIINLYTINYSNSDKNETLDKFQLIIKKGNEIIETSPWITNSNTYKGTVLLENGQNYTISTNYKTINGLSKSVNSTVTVPIFNAIPTGVSYLIGRDIDNGLNVIEVTNMTTYNFTSLILYRTNNTMQSWEKIIETTLSTNKTISIKDNTIESSAEYIYGLYVEYTVGTETKQCFAYSNGGTIYKYKNDFQHMYLSDGERQLCIKFNPDVSSFKTNIQQQKTEMIGSKYPVFFNNGKMRYNEFALTGLISYQMDQNYLFYKISGLSKGLQSRSSTNSSEESENQWTTQLTADNYKNEKEFKLEVLNWLNNNKPKILRTPQEGNYVVNLMNVSLAPEKTTGRLLHTFSATAYESMELNYENLKNSNLLLNLETRGIINADTLQNHPASDFISYVTPDINGNVLKYNGTTWISATP